MKTRIEEEIKKKAVNNRLSCAAARALAEELSLSYKDVGEAADRLSIKITNCQLGCF